TLFLCRAPIGASSSNPHRETPPRSHNRPGTFLSPPERSDKQSPACPPAARAIALPARLLPASPETRSAPGKQPSRSTSPARPQTRLLTDGPPSSAEPFLMPVSPHTKRTFPLSGRPATPLQNPKNLPLPLTRPLVRVQPPRIDKDNPLQPAPRYWLTA